MAIEVAESTQAFPEPESHDEVLVPRGSDIQPHITVVMPTLNEEEGIVPCIQAVKGALLELGVLGEVIVSDSSSDRTAANAKAAGAFVVEPDQPGYGYAYRFAFQYARGEYIVMGDADMTYDFSSLPELLQPILQDDADIVLGSRFDGEIKPGAMPRLHRYVGNPMLTKFLNVFYDAGVSDAHSGFRVFRGDVLDRLELRSDGMEFASEMVMDAAAKDLRIAEIPITYHNRVGEEELDSFRDGWRHVKFMLENAPGYVFSLPSMLFLAVGVMMMALSLAGSSVPGITFGTHTMVGGSFLTIVGYQIGSLSVFSSVAVDSIRKPQDPITAWVREHISLEHGATAGLAMFTIGAVYIGWIGARWVISGVVGFQLLVWNILAFTLIVLGIQTIFFSFFLSMLGNESRP